ncbi:MAG: ribonuclease HIII [Candidatus Hydrothermarchaeaceae archaeon]
MIAGSDEAGKGDYFGYVVAACVCAEEKLLKDIGVKDSKTLSMGRIFKLDGEIRERCTVSVVSLSPRRYNQLHRDTGGKYNLNQILGWLHAKAISNIVKKCEPKIVVVDKFGKEENVLGNLKGIESKIVFMEKGERDPAVAAASIVARAEFLRRHEELSKQADIGIPLPRGSAHVKDAARKLVKERGRGALNDFVKLHFKITREII